MSRRQRRRSLRFEGDPPADREIVAALGYVPIVGERPDVCPDCDGRTCHENCPTAAANGWPVEILRERPF
jgi:hypothetical protein